MFKSLILKQRNRFYKDLVDAGLLGMALPKPTSKRYVSTVSDVGSEGSRAIGYHLTYALGGGTLEERGKAQTSGNIFEELVAGYIERSLVHLSHLSVAEFMVEHVIGRDAVQALAKYWPYQHLQVLEKKIKGDAGLRSVLGNVYAVSPDILVVRKPFSDSVINRHSFVVGPSCARRTAIRSACGGVSEAGGSDGANILHAVVSCKWTIRSDRAQNSRSEALNLLRNRKGRAPHIVVVTADPSITRLASIAMGTGDVDMVYHVALDQLRRAVALYGTEAALQTLDDLLEGKRLRDISDLPFDLLL